MSDSPGRGGRYVVTEDGERTLVHETKPRLPSQPEQEAQADESEPVTHDAKDGDDVLSEEVSTGEG